MKRTNLFAILAGTLLLMSFLGCGATYKRDSITLTPSGSGGLVNLKGEGGTIQFQAMLNGTNGKSEDVTPRVTYTVTVATPGVDVDGFPLLPPPQTVLMSPTGLITAVETFDCSWTDTRFPSDRDKTDPNYGKPAWALTGSYKVVASLNGLQSNPVYVGVASSTGNGPAGECGP